MRGGEILARNNFNLHGIGAEKLADRIIDVKELTINRPRFDALVIIRGLDVGDVGWLCNMCQDCGACEAWCLNWCPVTVSNKSHRSTIAL